MTTAGNARQKSFDGPLGLVNGLIDFIDLLGVVKQQRQMSPLLTEPNQPVSANPNTISQMLWRDSDSGDQNPRAPNNSPHL